jgi:hypothetical protein|nr:MAG TPA: hypothetical protein [Caudoviricetes sp.]
MKLSKLTTEQAVDVLCELTPYIANITGDKVLLDELGKKFDGKGKSVAELYTYGAQKYAMLVPVLLKDHRADVFGILSVLNDTTAEVVAKQNVLTTILQIRSVFKDKDLLDFFRSFGQEDGTA